MYWTIASLAIFGVFSILLYAFGQLQFADRAGRYDITKAIADSNSDGLIVTDAHSRIIYANDAYRALSGAKGAADLRLVERLFTGAPEVSEAVYRLAQAARAGNRAAEELRMAPPLTGEGAAAWYRIRVRPLERHRQGRRDAVDGRRHHARARAARKLLSRPATRHRLSRSRAGGLFLRRTRRLDRAHERHPRQLARLRHRAVRRRPAQAFRLSWRPTARLCSASSPAAPGK